MRLLRAESCRTEAPFLATVQDLGNTLIVVEHDEDAIATADWVVDIGPGAGEHGGQVVVRGTVQELLGSPD